MRRKPVHVFLLHAAFVLALLGAFSGVRDVYSTAFHAAGNVVLGSLGGGLSIEFKGIAAHERPDSADTRMRGYQAGRAEKRWEAVYSSHRRGFWPTATLLALIVATPMSRRRLVLAVPLGVVLFNAFFLLLVAAFGGVLFGATTAELETAKAWRRVIPVAEALFNSPISNYAGMFLVWALVANPARGIDLASVNALIRQLMGQRPVEGAPPAPPAAAAAAEKTEKDEDLGESPP